MIINLKFANFEVNAKIKLRERERLAIYGASGSGKSSILRAMAGLNNGAAVPLRREEIGFLHQNCTLFEHQNVLENLQTCEHKSFFSSLRARIKPPKMSEFHRYLLSSAQLLHKAQANISELSGGERQRAALCAALATRPKWLLLDEPFSALDDASKRALIALVRKICDELGTSVVLISHSAAEIAAIAERVLLLRAGSVEAELGIDEFKSRFLLPLDFC